MEKIGLVRNMTDAVIDINHGRRGHSTPGVTEEGLAELRDGLVRALQLFYDAIASGDAELMLAAELSYASQELTEARNVEQLARQSAETAVSNFNDAVSTLEAVQQGEAYRIADMTFPHSKSTRYSKDRRLPNDSYHCAMAGNFIRLKNKLTNFSLLPEDIDLMTTRRVLCAAAQKAYAVLQRKALGLIE